MDLVAVTADTAVRGQAVAAAAFAHDFVGLPADPVSEVLAALTPGPGAGNRIEYLLGTSERVDVLAATIDYPVRDNLDEATVAVITHPEHRRRGHATAGLAAVVARCLDLGRTRLLAEVPGRLDGVPSAAQVLAARLGFVPKLEEVRRVLDTEALDADHLAALHRDAARRAEGYRLLSWAETAPSTHLPGLTALSARMSLDAPMGDLQREPEDWDVTRWLARERDAIAKGRLRLGTMALRGDDVVAYTDFGINRERPVVGYQWDTIVRADHRGHRLGMLTKIANLRLLQERSPETRWINTWNAASNRHMIAINEALGWRPVDTWTESQLDLWAGGALSTVPGDPVPRGRTGAPRGGPLRR